MITSYHTHSSLSDGTTDLAAMVAGAKRLGLVEFGISDHYVMLPGKPYIDWSMPLDALPMYFEGIEKARALAGNEVNVRAGLEAEFNADTADELRGILDQYPFDYVIGGIHYVGDFPVDKSADCWEGLTQADINDIAVGYWQALERMAKSRMFNFAAHIDLYKIYGHRPDCDLSGPMSAALDAIAEAEMFVELNTAGWFKPVGEAYPSPHILAECKKRGIEVFPSGDSHTPENLTRAYDRARTLLDSFGFSKTPVFEGRKARV